MFLLILKISKKAMNRRDSAVNFEDIANSREKASNKKVKILL
jgi:hypothetical protein